VDQSHYAIAVYGIPSRMAGGDPQRLADQFKKEAALKHDGQKEIKPSEVQVLQREGGPVVVYLFRDQGRSQHRTGGSNSTPNPADWK
jgi:hypothetical protein